MGCTPVGGTQDADFVAGKTSYFDSHSPNTTTITTNGVPGTTPVDIFWLLSELDHEEDIEIGVTYDAGGGHWLTLIGIFWIDRNMNGIIDGDDTAQITYIDPLTGAVASSVASMDANGNLRTEYGGGATIDFAVAESPIPEPATLLLVFSAGSVLLRIRLKRKS